ncbi:MAG: conjugal transfer protein TraI [Candidatus Pseudobacter hemicellulosilyticus]|uniref:Conjugal transfer protein TraI n=1 Tax=Candidatus Pseudobacter hemicellulosilyticus TaxID=3121375 RepID=A0AAJ5WSA9_9BACT|nr:MAG: conjugal transfer protein TraI [Pseudobacter sp.]
MKKLRNIVMLLFCLALVCTPTQKANAGIYEVIKAAVVKAIKALDLAIQRQQNAVIWLQNAQKVLENTLSKLKLGEISDWSERQREQYASYFDELRKVKLLITYYQRIRDISETQLKLVNEYGRVWKLIKDDQHFTAEEVTFMAEVYTGILAETVKNVDQLSLVVNSFRVQMSDAQRLEVINEVAEHVNGNYTDLVRFNAQNGKLRLQRAGSAKEIEMVRLLYGLK